MTEHPITRRYADKIFLHDERDRPWCAMLVYW